MVVDAAAWGLSRCASGRRATDQDVFTATLPLWLGSGTIVAPFTPPRPPLLVYIPSIYTVFRPEAAPSRGACVCMERLDPYIVLIVGSRPSTAPRFPRNGSST